MTKLRLQVLAGIAAGEVRRVKIGNKFQVQWYKPEGHELGWGRTHGKVFTRWPTVIVTQFEAAEFVTFTTGGVAVLTSAGKKLAKDNQSR